MSNPANGAAPAAAPANTVNVGDRTIVVERPSGLKASRALAELKAITRAVPEVSKAMGDFVREYERTHVVELDRVQAAYRFPPRQLIDPETRQPVKDENGQEVMQPGRLDHLTDEDWQAAGGILKIPDRVPTAELIAAVFPTVSDTAERHVFRLLAVFATSNRELKAQRPNMDEFLDEEADALLADGYFDELLELAVVCAEAVDHHFTRKARDLGDRLGNLRAFIGKAKPTNATTSTPQDSPPSSRPTSSTDSPESSTGDPTTPSTPTTNSSSTSDTDSTATPRPSETEPNSSRQERTAA